MFCRVHMHFWSCVLTIYDTSLNSGSILTLNFNNHKEIVCLLAHRKIDNLEGNLE